MDTAIQPAVPPAKPVPRKRRYWRVVIVSACVLLLLPVLASFIAGWLGEREMQRICAEIEADDPNWQWHDLIASMPPAPDDENAFLQIGKVGGLLKKTPFAIAPVWDNDAKQKSRQVRNARLSEDNIALLRAAFAPLDPKVLPEARKLKDMAKGRMKIDSSVNPFDLLLPDVQTAREVMRVLDSDILLRTHENDLDGAAESWRALLNTSRAIEDNPTLIAQLVRMAGQAISVAALERLLGQDELPDAELATMQALLKRETDDNLLYFGLRGERAVSHRMYTDLRDGKTTISKMMGGMGMMGKPGTAENIVDFFPGIVLRGYPDHLRLFDEQVKASKLKDVERAEAMAKIEQKVRDSRNIITRLLMPATQKVAEAAQRSQAQLRSAMVAVAAERYRVKHDAWPTGFADLQKDGLLTEIPIDPYDGKQLRFKRTPTGIIIYSVSFDKIDNQGNLDRSNPRTPGSDIGFELWDRHLRAAPPPVELEQ